MKLKYTCFLYLLLISSVSFSQPPKKNTNSIPRKIHSSPQQQKNVSHSQGKTGVTNAKASSAAVEAATGFKSPLTGVWRGFFTSGSGFFQEKYKYEIQLGQLASNGIKGVTYSYKTTVFYGKASLAGMYTPSTKNLVLKETKLIEVKMTSGDACLMTCYLEYSKVGGTEILEGTFTSVNTNQNADCGNGRVYLEKVQESDFYKEDFVKEFETKKKNEPIAKPTTPKTAVVIAKPKPKQTTTTTDKNKNKRTEEIVKVDPPVVPRTPGSSEKTIGKVDVTPPLEAPKKPIAKELKERENTVTKVIEAEGDEIEIALYDNGQIDGDTVTVYHNKQVVAWKKGLCHKPIIIKIKVDPNHPRNEIVMVADNLGSIPPNTALMVVTIGKQRYDVSLTSDFHKHATVIVMCKLPSRDSK
jgi:hypothetical protein